MSQKKRDKTPLESGVENVNNIYSPVDKSRMKAKGIVARLWRNICAELSISPDYIFRELRLWINSASSGIPNTGSARSTERGNVIKEITRPQMTLHVLLKVLVAIVGARNEVEFSIKFKRKGQREPKTYSVKIDDVETYVRNSRKRSLEE